jgi:hypothetical protein
VHEIALLEHREVWLAPGKELADGARSEASANYSAGLESFLLRRVEKVDAGGEERLQ